MGSVIVGELKEKLREITERMNGLRAEIVALERQQASFTDVIRVYEPDFNLLLPAKPNHKKSSNWNSASNRVTELLSGRNNRHVVLDILRRCDHPISSAEIARAFGSDINLGDELAQLESVLSSRFSATLDRLSKQGLVRHAGTIDGRRHLWEINR